MTQYATRQQSDMINIQDIHFDDQIFPLFDSTQNLFSSRALREWFRDKPASLEEVLTRQEIIKGFIQNRQLHQYFTYSKTAFNDVYGYIEDFRNKDLNKYEPAKKWHLFFNHKERQKEAGNLSQLVLFLHKASSFYFAGLDTTVFPEWYAQKMELVRAFAAGLDIEILHKNVRGRGLKIRHIIRLQYLIREKIKKQEWDFFWEEFFLFEAHLSLAKAVIKLGYKFPDFSKGKIEFKNFYHPIVRNPVRNHLTIDNQVWVLTGPNMSGKSTLLKAITLCVFLGHQGMAVPASSCDLVFFDVISISTHLKDDLLNGYSHFMTEIKLLRNILEQEQLGRKCFAVFDEMFKGTNEEDALAISSLSIIGLAKSVHSYFLVSTHLHQLKSLIETDAGKITMACLDCDLQGQRPVFTYKLKPGWSDLKIGQILFKLEGLDKLLPS